jgi:hypothetical protein
VRTTEIQRAAWQRRAAHTLTTILHEHPHLPAIAWTIAPVGCALTARVSTCGDPGRSEQVFTAWRTALDLTEHRAHYPDGIFIRLWAHGHLDGTRINLSATTSNDH